MRKRDYLLNMLENILPTRFFNEAKKYLKIKPNQNDKKITQTQLVMDHLMTHGDITNAQCHELYGIRHCPAVIKSVKKKLALEGRYKIDTEKKKGCNRYGKPVTWKTYILKLNEVALWK